MEKRVIIAINSRKIFVFNLWDKINQNLSRLVYIFDWPRKLTELIVARVRQKLLLTAKESQFREVLIELRLHLKEISLAQILDVFSLNFLFLEGWLPNVAQMIWPIKTIDKAEFLQWLVDKTEDEPMRALIEDWVLRRGIIWQTQHPLNLISLQVVDEQARFLLSNKQLAKLFIIQVLILLPQLFLLLRLFSLFVARFIFLLLRKIPWVLIRGWCGHFTNKSDLGQIPRPSHCPKHCISVDLGAFGGQFAALH